MSDNKIIKAIKDKGKTLEAEMSFFDHLEALRWHLVELGSHCSYYRCCFLLLRLDFDTVIMGPSKSTFWTYRMLCKMGECPTP
jgi:sec-independent protein translocase protein TatC